ncbi:MAG: hypothetical protein LAP21_23545 [Acidobacteriia bacterium]|nr:hypothetical protein [Terriglobia bacterium]
MKRIFVLLIACAGLLVMSASAQSLGDIARQNRANKKPSTGSKIVIDNDTMPSVGAAPEAKDKTEAKKDEGKAEPPKDAGKSAEDWKSKIDSQKKEIVQLQRELDVSEREAKLRAAAFYADAGTMLRDQAKFAEDTRNQQAEMDNKRQAIEAAKQKLADLQEQARKAGAPSNQTD